MARTQEKKLVTASFEDIDDLCATIETWDAELVPLSRAHRGECAGTIIQTGSVDCQYMYAEFPVGLTMHGSPPEGLITFNVQEPTKRHYWWRGHDLTSAVAWVFPASGQLQSISAPGFQVHTLSVTEDRVAAVAARFGIDLPPGSKRPEVFPVPTAILYKVRALLNAMRKSSIALSFTYTDEVLRLLIPLWLPRKSGKEWQRPSIRARDRAIRKSLEIIESYDVQRLTADVLLGECHVSERTLQYAFRECFATSPAAFIRSVRLARARSALRRADPALHTVGDIAATFGFWHLGQFAHDYRRKFGERPSETLAKSGKLVLAQP